jgi:hypothetical protein
MKFIELTSGTRVRLDAIVAIERLSDFDVAVSLNTGRVFEVTFPYLTLVDLLEMSDEGEKELLGKINESVRSLPIQVFAG